MKKLFLFLGIVALFAACQKTDPVTELMEDPSLKLASIDGEKLVGAHYNLNIIGVKGTKTADMTGSNGHVIFVGLGTPKEENAVTTRIYLYDSEDSEDSDADFRVLDANGTDGVAAFELPKPGYDPYVIPADEPVESKYSIYVRPLGKPGGWATITTCADLADEDALFGMLPNADQKDILNAIDDGTGAYCSIEQVGSEVTMRTKGKTSFTNVTAELTSIVFKIEVWIDADADGIQDEGEVTTYYVRVPIFDAMLDNEYWKYDNNGLKLLQVRIYPWGTDVTYADLLIN